MSVSELQIIADVHLIRFQTNVVVFFTIQVHPQCRGAKSEFICFSPVASMYVTKHPNWRGTFLSVHGLSLQPLMLVSCHAALTTEKAEPVGQEQKLVTKKKKNLLLVEHAQFQCLEVLKNIYMRNHA